MSTTLKYLGSVILGVGLTVAVHANTIVGGITLTGGVTGNNAMDPAAAAGFMNFQIDQVSGSYSLAGVRSGTSVSMFGFNLNPFQALGVVPLWHTISGPVASFDMSQIVSVNRFFDESNNPRVTLTGYGILRLFGYDPTPGSWTYDSAGGGVFSFDTSQGDSVPDGGTTAILLGAGLCALAVLRRRFA